MPIKSRKAAGRAKGGVAAGPDAKAGVARRHATPKAAAVATHVFSMTLDHKAGQSVGTCECGTIIRFARSERAKMDPAIEAHWKAVNWCPTDRAVGPPAPQVALRTETPLPALAAPRDSELDARIALAAKAMADQLIPATPVVTVTIGADGRKREPDKGAEMSDKERKQAARDGAERRAKEKLEKAGGTPKLYYSRHSKDFWIQTPAGFRTYDKAEMKLHLLHAGVFEWPKVDELSPMDRVFLTAQLEREMDYIGPLPGYRVGAHEIDGRKMLVTDEADSRIWEPLPAEPVPEEKVSFLIGFLTALLGEQLQHAYMMNALAVALRCMRNAALYGPNAFRPLPFFGLIGEAKFGKSTFQDIITKILGGRADNPAKAMMEGEKFTEPLIRAEHWTFGDPPGTTRLEDRIFFGDKIKEFAHEGQFVFRGMQKAGFKVRCFRWVDGSFNKHESDLRKLPPLREGLLDKVSLHLCADARPFLQAWSAQSIAQQPLRGFHSVDGIDWPRVQAQIDSEVPFFRQWLLQTLPTVPAVWADMRGGVRAFHHKGLMHEISDLTPQATLLRYIDEGLFNPEPNATFPDFVFDKNEHRHWKESAVDYPYILLTAAELEQRLKALDLPPKLRERMHLIGRDLSDLEASHRNRVSKHGKGAIQLWRITNPFQATNETVKE